MLSYLYQPSQRRCQISFVVVDRSSLPRSIPPPKAEYISLKHFGQLVIINNLCIYWDNSPFDHLTACEQAHGTRNTLRTMWKYTVHIVPGVRENAAGKHDSEEDLEDQLRRGILLEP